MSTSKQSSPSWDKVSDLPPAARLLCAGCGHFRQHFIQCRDKSYWPTACGHCVYPRVRERIGGQSDCHNYAAKSAAQ